MARLGLTLGRVRDVIGEGELVGAADFFCESVASLRVAGAADLSFVKSERYFESASGSRAGALLVPARLEGIAAHQLVLSNPFSALGRLLHWISERDTRQEPGVDSSARVDPSATVGEGSTIGAGVVVHGRAVIGDRVVVHANAVIGRRSIVGHDSVIHSGAVIREGVVMGQRVTVHAGAVVGSDGYSFVSDAEGHKRIPQVGGVILGDDVEIGALATIDRATVDDTVIGRGTKVGDMVHVGHNCRVGANVLLLPMVAVSGSVEIGDGAIMAGRSGCSDNLKIGRGARIGGTAVAFKDVAEGEVVWGSPARPRTQEMRIQVLLGKLPSLFKDVARLKRG